MTTKWFTTAALVGLAGSNSDGTFVASTPSDSRPIYHLTKGCLVPTALLAGVIYILLSVCVTPLPNSLPAAALLARSSSHVSKDPKEAYVATIKLIEITDNAFIARNPYLASVHFQASARTTITSSMHDFSLGHPSYRHTYHPRESFGIGLFVLIDLHARKVPLVIEHAQPQSQACRGSQKESYVCNAVSSQRHHCIEELLSELLLFQLGPVRVGTTPLQIHPDDRRSRFSGLHINIKNIVRSGHA